MKFWKRKSFKKGFKRAATVFGRQAIRKGASLFTGGASEQAYAAYESGAAKVKQFLPPKLQEAPRAPVAPGGYQSMGGAAPVQRQQQGQQRPWWASGGR